MPSTFEIAICVALPALLTCLASLYLSTDTGTVSDGDGSSANYSYLALWVWSLLLDATYGQLFYTILLIPARRIASRLPGSNVPPLNEEERLREQEEESNDPTIIWPSPEIIAKLPEDWVVVHGRNNDHVPPETETLDNNSLLSSSKSHPMNNNNKKKKRSTKNKTKASSGTANSGITSSQDNSNTIFNKPINDTQQQQPYYLNHVRGSTRIRHATQRIAAAMGTLFSAYILCSYTSPLVTLDDIGLGMSSYKRVLLDVTLGFIVGASIVIFIFIIELRMKWIRITGYFETVVEGEDFAINFAWDILFHVGVSINEEVMLRGWMFIMGCRGLLLPASEWFNDDDPSTAATFAIATSIVLQSTLFAFLHLYSPGSTMVSLLNLFLGGIAASLNVMVAGGTLWLGIGWHFGWNMLMGHVLGRSTSGIPMSCAVIGTLPRPALSANDASYTKFHGGTFGPEQGVLAPVAYILGMAMVIWLYGWEDLEVWRGRLVMGLESP